MKVLVIEDQAMVRELPAGAWAPRGTPAGQGQSQQKTRPEPRP